MSTPNKLLMAASGGSKPFLVTTLYTGNSTNFREFNVGHATSMVINRMRNPPASQPWCLSDVVRGAGKPIRPDRQLAETDSANTIREFTSNGFKTGTSSLVNQSPYNYVAYSFTTNNPLSNTNEEGTITSTINVGTDYGFSICTYTGSGVINTTYGHGLDLAPELVITKRRDSNVGWIVTGTVLGANTFIQLDLTNAVGSITNTPVPTSSVVNLGSDTAVNASGGTYVAYCFHSVTGRSKVGTYTGNGNSNGPIITLGFRPAFVMIKSKSTGPWIVLDSTRDTSNPRTVALDLDDDAPEYSISGGVNFGDSTFTIKSSISDLNTNNQEYIFLAIAEES